MPIITDYVNSILGYGTWHDAVSPEKQIERNELAFRVLVELAFEDGAYAKIKAAVKSAAMKNHEMIEQELTDNQ